VYIEDPPEAEYTSNNIGGNQHQNRSQNRSKAHIPARRESIFRPLRFPKPPKQPVLPQFHSLCVLCDLCGYKSIMQNKPNFQNPETNATSFTAKDYRRKPLLLDSKKQTQTNPILALRQKTFARRVRRN